MILQKEIKAKAGEWAVPAATVAQTNLRDRLNTLISISDELTWLLGSSAFQAGQEILFFQKLMF